MLILRGVLMKRTFNLQKTAKKVLLKKGPKFMMCRKRMEDIAMRAQYLALQICYLFALPSGL
jgi:hypothetical protein